MTSSEAKKQKLESVIHDRINYDDRNGVTFSSDFPFHMIVIPPLLSLSQSTSPVVIDDDMLQDLQQARVLNWCRTADKLYPLHTKSDGNCLCHAVSMATWGVADEKLTLRSLIRISINSPEKKKRWLHHYENSGLNDRDSLRLSAREWEREWKHVTEASLTTNMLSAVTPYTHLEAIHVFTLAHILRRPIIVIADLTARSMSGTSLQENDIGGLYLPLDRPASDCHKYPIVLGHTLSHICPLLPQETAGKSVFTVPLVTRDGSSLPIKFLNADEEKNVPALFKSYLKVKEIPLSSSDSVNLVLCAEMKSLPLPDTLKVFPVSGSNIQQIVRPVAHTAQSASSATASFEAVRCITKGCPFYGSPATGNMCSACLDKYLKHPQVTALHHQPQQHQTPSQHQHQFLPQQQLQFNIPEPTAPPPSMPLSQPFVDLSIMGEVCATGCGLRCSTKTYPFCHECAEQKRISKGQSSQAGTSSKIYFPASSGSVGIAGSHMETGGSHSERVYGTSYGSTETTLAKSQPTLAGSEGACGMVGTENTTYTENTAALFGMGNVAAYHMVTPGNPVCKGDDCNAVGKSHLGGLCDRCFMKEERKKKICRTPGCLGNRGDQGYCQSCQSKQVDKRQPSESGLSEGMLESGGMGGHLSSSSLIESGTNCKAESVKVPVPEGSEDKIKCASPMCNRLIYPPNKLCSTCIEILRRNQISNQQQRASPIEPTVVSLSDDINQTWPPNGRSLSTPIAVRQPMLNVQLSEYSRSSSAPIGRKCVTPSCTKFGDPSMADMCTACYQISVSGARNPASSRVSATSDVNPFSVMMERVASQKRSPRHCKAARCTNYGNQNNEGFCNSCYPQYLAMKNNL